VLLFHITTYSIHTKSLVIIVEGAEDSTIEVSGDMKYGKYTRNLLTRIRLRIPEKPTSRNAITNCKLVVLDLYRSSFCTAAAGCWLVGEKDGVSMFVHNFIWLVESGENT
jgi:hypothetical protein